MSEPVDAVAGRRTALIGAARWRTALLGLLALAVAAQLVVLYAPAQPDGVPSFVHADKVVHVLVFLVPTALALLAGFRPAVVVSLFAGHAVVSELVQGGLLPARAGDPRDVLADLTGIALGVLLARAVAAAENFRPRKRAGG